MADSTKNTENTRQSTEETTGTAAGNPELLVLFLFYNMSFGKQSRLSFSKEFQHCNTITYDGKTFILLEWDSEGIKTRVIKSRKMSTIIRNVKLLESLSALICVQIRKRKSVKWKPFIVRSCNEIARYSAGIDIGFTFNPVHLHNKLLRYAVSKKRNFDVLALWRRTQNGNICRQQGAKPRLGATDATISRKQSRTGIQTPEPNAATIRYRKKSGRTAMGSKQKRGD